MNAIITKADFDSGYYKIARSTANDPTLQAYIDKYQEDSIHLILGKTVGTLFAADINGSGVPVTTKYLTIFNAIRDEDSGGAERLSIGMKKILQAIIYYWYVSQEQVMSSQSGMVATQNETSDKLSPEMALRAAEIRYNDMLSSIRTIQWYCMENTPTDYPDFNGKRFEAVYSSFL